MYQRGRAAPAEGWAVPMPSAASAAPDHLPERRGVPPRAAARAVLHLALAVIALAATACVYLRATIDSPADRCERRGVCGARGARKKCRAPPSRAERRGHTFFACREPATASCSQVSTATTTARLGASCSGALVWAVPRLPRGNRLTRAPTWVQTSPRRASSRPWCTVCAVHCQCSRTHTLTYGRTPQLPPLSRLAYAACSISTASCRPRGRRRPPRSSRRSPRWRRTSRRRAVRCSAGGARAACTRPSSRRRGRPPSQCA